MKSKIPALSLIGFILLSIGLIKANFIKKQSPELEDANERGTLKWYAKKAKEKGAKQVSIGAPVPIYEVVNSLDEAIPYYSVVIVQPIEKRSYADGDYSVKSWYKLRIIETLSDPKRSPCDSCAPFPEPPSEMLPLNGDEILVPLSGGALDVDGVRIVSKSSEFPGFLESERYLLFLSRDPSGRVGRIGLGAGGIFAIHNDGTLEAAEKQEHPIKRDIRNLHGDSLERVKSKLKTKSASK